MTDIYTTELVALGANLAQMAVKGTATAVSAKIRAIKDEKNAEKIRNTYDEIVNELLSEREEAVRIAQRISRSWRRSLSAMKIFSIFIIRLQIF